MPGQEITLNTVIVAGLKTNVLTYGIYADLKIENWSEALR